MNEDTVEYNAKFQQTMQQVGNLLMKSGLGPTGSMYALGGTAKALQSALQLASNSSMNEEAKEIARSFTDEECKRLLLEGFTRIKAIAVVT